MLRKDSARGVVYLTLPSFDACLFATVSSSFVLCSSVVMFFTPPAPRRHHVQGFNAVCEKHAGSSSINIEQAAENTTLLRFNRREIDQSICLFVHVADPGKHDGLLW